MKSVTAVCRLLLVYLFTGYSGVALAEFHYQKPGADIRLVNGAPITVNTEQVFTHTLTLQPPREPLLLEVTVQPVEGFELVSQRDHWLLEANGQPLSLPMEIRAGKQAGRFALTVLIRAWPQSANNARARSRVLSQGIIVNRHTGSGAQKTTSSVLCGHH